MVLSVKSMAQNVI